MSAALRTRLVRRTSPGGEASPPSGIRLLTGAVGALLIGSYLSVFYRVTAIAGDVRLLAVTVGCALLLATVLANRVPVRRGLGYGTLLLVAGVFSYLALVPELHDFLFTVDFVVSWFAYLTGRSVLRFLSVDVWAITVAPGPTLLTWYLLLRRRYDLAALTGGLMLGFFVLTGDADRTTALIGMTSLLGLLGLGAIEKADGTWQQVEHLGFVLAFAVLVARSLRIVPDDLAGSAAGGPDGDTEAPIHGGLDDADGQVGVFGSISLSPERQFTVASDTSAYWRVGAYDRYTGRGWIRTGRPKPYDGGIAPPAGETTTVEQRVRIERSTRAMPAAWKPVRVHDAGSMGVRVTGSDGLRPDEPLSEGESYTVVSEVPEADPDRLRAAGTDYPEGIRERYLRVPRNTPSEVRRLAEDVAGDTETPYDAAVAIERWLRRNKAYSLTVDRPEGDIVAGFLLSMDRGYCVYYASAMAVMLRTIGIPARFVLGYTPGEDDDERWIVRGVHSHAWIEVYFPGVGWIPFDPTPAEPRRADEQSRLGNATGARIDPRDRSRGTSTRPPDRFADRSFPTTATSTPGGRADGPADSEGTDAEAGSGRPRGLRPVDRMLELGSGRDRLSVVAALIASVIGVRWLGLFGRMRRALHVRRQRPSLSPERDVERAYDRLERLLARHYRERRDNETPRRYLGAIGPDDERTRRVLELYERARYAGTVSRADADEAIQLVDELVTEYGSRSRPDR